MDYIEGLLQKQTLQLHQCSHCVWYNPQKSMQTVKRIKIKEKKSRSCWLKENMTFTEQILALCFITESYFACVAGCMWYESMMKCADVRLLLHSDKPAWLELKSAPTSPDWLLQRGRESTERQEEDNWILIRLDWKTDAVISKKGGGLAHTHTHTNMHICRVQVRVNLLAHKICTFYSWETSWETRFQQHLSTVSAELCSRVVGAEVWQRSLILLILLLT